MNEIEIRFASDFPLELRERVRAAVARYAPFVAHAVDSFHIHYAEDGGEDGGGASTVVQRQYRRAIINLSEGFFRMEPELREQFIAHEVTHVLTDPIWYEAIRILNEFAPEEAYNYVRGTLEAANELETESIARAIARAIATGANAS